MIRKNREYIVTGSSSAKTRNGKDYCTLKLRSESEEGSLNVWDVAAEQRPSVGEIVAFKDVQDRDGNFSAPKEALQRRGPALPNHPLYALIPHPISQSEWQGVIGRLQRLATDARLANLIGQVADKMFASYATRPAAKNVHHAFPGGLLNHTYQMLTMLEAIHSGLPFTLRIDHCALAILFHDYGKVYEYHTNGDIKEDLPLLGHIFISANRLYEQLQKANIDEEQTKRIIHIVLAHHGCREYGSPVLPATKEAILVHALDDLSAKMDAHEGTAHLERCFALETNAVKALPSTPLPRRNEE